MPEAKPDRQSETEREAGADLRRRALPVLVLLFVASALVTALLARHWLASERVTPPPRIVDLPSFDLTNRDGERLRLSDLAGEVWIADFIFTRCGGVCPRMTERMIRIGGLEGDPSAPRRVSISVDPGYDTPEVLAHYADAFGIGDERWLFLTGERAALYDLIVEGFRLAVEDDPPAGSTHPDEPILHSNRFVLVDGAGTVRGYYDPFRPEELLRLTREAALVAAGS